MIARVVPEAARKHVPAFGGEYPGVAGRRSNTLGDRALSKRSTTHTLMTIAAPASGKIHGEAIAVPGSGGPWTKIAIRAASAGRTSTALSFPSLGDAYLNEIGQSPTVLKPVDEDDDRQK